MNQELFKYLPSEIIINILSRLPVKTIISCKFVCKSWLNLLNSHEFATSHFSKSKPGLVFNRQEDGQCLSQIFEFEDSLDLESHELHYNPVANLDMWAFISLPHASITVEGSANGLLILNATNAQRFAHYVCNPITREYIQIPEESVNCYPSIVSYGFGVSNLAGHHKLVRIFHDWNWINDDSERIEEFVCQVYTLGTGSWRSIIPSAIVNYDYRNGVFLNGNLHWLVDNLKGWYWISCFDLETELFSTFSLPSDTNQRNYKFLIGMGSLRDCLCLCDNTTDDEIIIWLMKEYGDEKSWTKELVISKIPDFFGESWEIVYPIKIFRDGDILMAWEENCLFYSSNKTKSISYIDMFELQSYGCVEAIPYTPSFISLRRFAGENANSF